MDPFVVSCAVTGSIHIPSVSSHLSVTPEEIIEKGIAAAEAGATIVHIHTRDPETGKPTADLGWDVAGREPATPAEVQEFLDLKGQDAVNF